MSSVTEVFSGQKIPPANACDTFCSIALRISHKPSSIIYFSTVSHNPHAHYCTGAVLSRSKSGCFNKTKPLARNASEMFSYFVLQTINKQDNIVQIFCDNIWDCVRVSENFPLLYGMLGKLSSEEFYTSTLIMK